MQTLDIRAETASGKPLEVLSALLAKRIQFLGETASDALIATGITALKSIRAATRKGKVKLKADAKPEPSLSVSVRRMPNLRVSFAGRSRGVCVRDIGGARHPEIKPWFRVSPAELPMSHVYCIELSGDRVKAWPFQRRVSYMIAKDDASAKRIVEARFSNVKAKSSGLAKDALTLAMQLASSRQGSMISGRKQMLSQKKLVRVTKAIDTASGNGSITIIDDLDYATNALKGGAQAVDASLARAANSITGMIANIINKTGTGFFGEAVTIERPFPPSCFTPEGGVVL